MNLIPIESLKHQEGVAEKEKVGVYVTRVADIGQPRPSNWQKLDKQPMSDLVRRHGDTHTQNAII